MSTIILPKPTMANERLWPIQIEPRYQVFVNGLLEKNGWKHCGADWFQPLFGLTAKDTTGKVRTVVEGNVVYLGDPDAQTPCGIILYHQHGFVIATNLGVCPIQEFIDEGNAPMILCHCTDIVAAGGKLRCYGCHGSGDGGYISGKPELCAICGGSGQHEIVWEE